MRSAVVARLASRALAALVLGLEPGSRGTVDLAPLVGHPALALEEQPSPPAGSPGHAADHVSPSAATPPPEPGDQPTWMTPIDVEHPTPWGLLDLDRAQGTPPRWRQATALTGDWGGLRDPLAHDLGITLTGAYTAEIAGNPIGGEQHKVAYTHNIGLALMVDLGRLAGLDETYFLVSGSSRSGNSNSGRDIGNVLAVQQLFGGQTTRLVQLALAHRLFDDRLEIVAGRIHGLDDFIASPLYCNSQNLGLCGNPLSIPTDISISSYPNAAWGARVRWQALPALYLMGGAYNAFRPFRANQYHGVDFSIREDSGWIGIGEAGFLPHRLPGDAWPTALPGHYKLGGYHDSEPATVFSTGRSRRGTHGFYVGFDQMLWREPGSSELEGLTLFAAAHQAPPDVNPWTWFFDGGLLYQGALPDRPLDVLGLYLAWVGFSSELADSQEALGQLGQEYELILEANYRIDLLPWFYLQPDVQGVIHPGGRGDIQDALVFALQLGVPF